MKMIKLVHDKLMDALYGNEEQKWDADKKKEIEDFWVGFVDFMKLLDQKKEMDVVADSEVILSWTAEFVDWSLMGKYVVYDDWAAVAPQSPPPPPAPSVVT